MECGVFPFDIRTIDVAACAVCDHPHNEVEMHNEVMRGICCEC